MPKVGKLQPFVARNIVLIALLAAVLGRLILSYPLNGNLLQGTDSSAYLHRIWLSAQGLLDWDSSWYGGYPSLKFYPPLNYLFATLAALVGGSVAAYKAVMDLFFVLAPVAFYALVKGFRLPKSATALAVLLFSFSPVAVYYFWNNSYVATINIVFLILVWKCFKDYAEKPSRRNLVWAGLFFGLSVLVHHLTAFLNIAIVVPWIFLRYRKFAVWPLVLGLLISGFWLFPFALEYAGGENLLRAADAAPFFEGIIYHLGLWPSLAAAFLVSAALAYGVLRSKDNDVLPLAASLVLITAALLLTSYNRILLVLPIPLALLLSKLATDKASSVMALAVLVAFAALFYGFHPLFNLDTFPQWDVPPAADRVIYYPASYDFGLPNDTLVKFRLASYVAPAAGQELANGWFHQSQLARDLKETRYPYLASLESPLNINVDETYRLLSAGYVNTVIVNRFHPEYVSYFEGSPHFKKINVTDNFVVFALDPPSHYAEAGGKDSGLGVSRSFGSIALDGNCAEGGLVIKESYDDYWSASVNGKPVAITPTAEGFMSVPIGGAGPCVVELSRAQPAYYCLFYAASLAALVYAAGIFLRKY